MKNRGVLFLTQGALIAALYVVLTLVANALGLASGAIQIRISEALTILPYFTAAAIPGLTIGCFLANLLAGGIIWDVIFGSLATLLGALLTYALRQHRRLAPLPPIVANMLIVPPILMFAYGFPGAWWYFVLTIGIGEFISCGLLGSALLRLLEKHRAILFPPLR